MSKRSCYDMSLLSVPSSDTIVFKGHYIHASNIISRRCESYVWVGIGYSGRMCYGYERTCLVTGKASMRNTWQQSNIATIFDDLMT